MPLPKTGIEPFDHYTSEVVNGRANVCKWVKLAVDRHYHDLDRQRTKEFPYYFEPMACSHYVDFFQEKLYHFDGMFSGKPVIFEPWQYFTFASPYAWMSVERIADSPVRRFNESIVIIPKKQGKSIILAGSMLYMIYWDDYAAAQVWVLAVNSSHAQTLAYRDVVKLVEHSPELKSVMRINRSASDMGVYYDENDAFIRPLTNDAKKADGPKIHMASLEEIKDWDDFDVYDTITNGTASDVNSMVASITTAGSDMSSLGYEREDYAKRLLNGEITDERTFAMIYTIDKDDHDKWDDIEVVKKANPNFGVSVHGSYYEDKIAKAQGSERKKNDFLTKHLGVWINSFDHYFTMDKWVNIGKKYKDLTLDDFEGKPCYIFIDLASKKDICPVQFLFRHGKCKKGKPRYATFGKYFLPNEVVSEDLVGHRAQYNEWASMGLFNLTPGNTVDYDEILDYVQRASKKFKVLNVGLDDWGIQQFSQSLKKIRIKHVEVPQRVKYLSEPMKTLEAHIINNDDKKRHDPRIIHNSDPVLTWAMGNVVAKEDANENVFPRKEHFNKKIDPAVALINLFCMEATEPLPKEFNRRKPLIMKV